MATAALTMICHTLLEASYVFTGTSNSSKEKFKSSQIASEALAFVQGTGLQVVIKHYGLDYNAEAIQSEFRRMFHIGT